MSISSKVITLDVSTFAEITSKFTGKEKGCTGSRDVVSSNPATAKATPKELTLHILDVEHVPLLRSALNWPALLNAAQDATMWCQQSGNSEGNSKELTIFHMLTLDVPLAEIR